MLLLRKDINSSHSQGYVNTSEKRGKENIHQGIDSFLSPSERGMLFRRHASNTPESLGKERVGFQPWQSGRSKPWAFVLCISMAIIYQTSLKFWCNMYTFRQWQDRTSVLYNAFREIIAQTDSNLRHLYDISGIYHRILSCFHIISFQYTSALHQLQ